MNNIKEAIRAEIERRKEENSKGSSLISHIKEDEDDMILFLIDSLQQEQPEVELETEIATWIPAHLKGDADKDTIDAVKWWGENVARHFVEWQKEQMLEDAIEGEVIDAGNFIKFKDGKYIDLNPTEREPCFSFQDGDKVKLIIVKEDE